VEWKRPSRQFDSLSTTGGTVTVGDGIPLQSKRSGAVTLDCLLSRGNCHRFILQDVLYVPALGHCLVSWNVMSCEGHMVHGIRRMYSCMKWRTCFYCAICGQIPIPSHSAVLAVAEGPVFTDSEDSTLAARCDDDYGYYWQHVLGH